MNETTNQPAPAYGYLRVCSDAAYREAPALERDMERFAQERGLQLVAIHREFAYGTLNAFTALADTLRRTGARHVLVPSLDHLGQSGALQRVLLSRLEASLDATVHALDAS
ncbi:recombinase family protein [Streptomyces sp. NPDC051217]|uniref:recombinase family protein n=1 Tax=Streptomyces sp. NPDC051217 TaxID=3365644 RepID=UPI0037B279DE